MTLAHLQPEFHSHTQMGAHQSEFDFGPITAPKKSSSDDADLRARRGQQNYLAGQSAECAVQRHYEDAGYSLLARRWRGGGGELDLVFQSGAGLTFVEVKKSRRHDLAAQRVSQQQAHRIFAAATVFVDRSDFDPFVDLRFDVALVDGIGAIHVHENALMFF